MALTLLLIATDFQQHFKEISRNHSPVQRPFYVHLTSVIVRVTLCTVRLFVSDLLLHIGYTIYSSDIGSRYVLICF